MHDPKSVAFEIRYPWRGAPSKLWPKGRRQSFITVWHVDPNRRGDDDSCGRFMRSRHGDPGVLDKIKSLYDFHWDADYGGWFDADGKPLLSPIGITYQMFQSAAWEHFGHDRRKADRFLKARLGDIINFAENPIDSLHASITGKHGVEKRDDRIEHFAHVVYGCVLRWSRPWCRDPIFHVHHWEIQCHPLQQFRRWAFSRCAGCGGRFSWGYSPISHSWGGDGPRWFRGEPGVYHHECSNVHVGSPVSSTA
jgi:hypothetical protein